MTFCLPLSLKSGIFNVMFYYLSTLDIITICILQICFYFISEPSSFEESEILRKNFVNLEARICHLDEKEKTESQKIENLIGRMTVCEKSVNESSTKNFKDVDLKVATFAKTIEENSTQVKNLNFRRSIFWLLFTQAVPLL